MDQQALEKTTILDAISLALFGQTARNNSNIEEQIMTMGTGHCFASVILEFPKPNP